MTGRLSITDASIRLDSMPPEGRDVVVEVNTDERAAIAAQLGVSAVERLNIALQVTRFSGGMRVAGKVTARIVQPSVVSLEPVTQHIEEPIDRVLLPGGGRPFASAAGAEIFVDLEGEDLPDHFEGPEADLSDLIIEAMALAIDPYPRLPGESIADLGISEPVESPESPFAKLKSLKQDGSER